MCIERCKHGFGRMLRKPTAEMRKGGAFLLYTIKLYNKIVCCFNLRKMTLSYFKMVSGSKKPLVV